MKAEKEQQAKDGVKQEPEQTKDAPEPVAKSAPADSNEEQKEERKEPLQPK